MQVVGAKNLLVKKVHELGEPEREQFAQQLRNKTPKIQLLTLKEYKEKLTSLFLKKLNILTHANHPTTPFSFNRSETLNMESLKTYRNYIETTVSLKLKISIKPTQKPSPFQ